MEEYINNLLINTNEIETHPFRHIVIDDFFKQNVAEELSAEFPDYDSDIWLGYNNPIEIKKINSHWHKFGPLTYRVLSYLNSPTVINLFSDAFDLQLHSDPGLHGGGWHIHARGGKLNPHLDYNLHPKLGLQRRLNLIVYLNKNWQESWGGAVGLWEGEDKPGALVKEVSPLFNRAVIFETVGSWHGLPKPIESPEGECRQSLAVYYLTEPLENADKRYKARFAAYGEQIGDKEVEELIQLRENLSSASKVYE